MTKVYFRLADGRSITREIVELVGYQQILQALFNKFKIQKQKIQLVYNGVIRTRNFRLDQSLPHHIVHVKNEPADFCPNNNHADKRVPQKERLVKGTSFGSYQQGPITFPITPSLVQLCTQELYKTTIPILHQLKQLPKYFFYANQIYQLQISGFFQQLQQEYEANRVTVIHSEYDAYRYPLDPGMEDEQKPLSEQGLKQQNEE